MLRPEMKIQLRYLTSQILCSLEYLHRQRSNQVGTSWKQVGHLARCKVRGRVRLLQRKLRPNAQAG